MVTKDLYGMFIAILFTIAKKLETSHVSINRKMDKQSVVYSHKGISFCN